MCNVSRAVIDVWQPAMAPTTPRRVYRQGEKDVEFYSPFTPPSQMDRPISEATEFIETDDEDDSSVFEEDSENSTSSRCYSV